MFAQLSTVIIFVMISATASAQNWSKYFADKNLRVIDTATIAGKKYISFFNNGTYYLLNTRGDTLLKKNNHFSNAELKDINNDGYKDVVLHAITNSSLMLDLFLYVPALKKFKEVKGFREFPDPTPITGTKYYYSYHKSGCADLNWDSDLFYIENFKPIRIGNIYGNACVDRDNPGDEKDGVYIYKVRGSIKKLIKTLPVQTLANYKDYKWGFIKEYWTKNYQLFIAN